MSKVIFKRKANLEAEEQQHDYEKRKKLSDKTISDASQIDFLPKVKH